MDAAQKRISPQPILQLCGEIVNRQRIENRLLSLARAHDLLTSENWSGANLTQVVDRALQPFSSSNNIVVSGRPIRVSPRQALALSMAVHELATNAVKYGA